MIISAVFALSLWFLAIGGLLYLIEFWIGRVTMTTLWKELDDYQSSAAALTIVGVLGTVGSLIAGAVLKA